jgi:hypothetical protein
VVELNARCVLDLVGLSGGKVVSQSKNAGLSAVNVFILCYAGTKGYFIFPFTFFIRSLFYFAEVTRRYQRDMIVAGFFCGLLFRT